MGKVSTKVKNDNDLFSRGGRSLEDVLRDKKTSTEDRIIACICECLNRLSLVRAVLNNEDLFKLEGYELSGVQESVNETYKLLKEASSIAFANA